MCERKRGAGENIKYFDGIAVKVGGKFASNVQVQSSTRLRCPGVGNTNELTCLCCEAVICQLMMTQT